MRLKLVPQKKKFHDNNIKRNPKETLTQDIKAEGFLVPARAQPGLFFSQLLHKKMESVTLFVTAEL